MAVKTITIDLEAYDALARRKKKGDSFSDVIKEHFGRRTTEADLLRAVRHLRFPEETLSRLDEVVAERGKSPARVRKL